MEIKLFIALLWATACKPSDGGKDWMTGTLFASRRAILELDLTSGSGFDMSGSQTGAELKV